MRKIALVVLALAIAPVARAADDTVATVGGTPITRSALEKHVRPQLIEIENERFEALSGGLDELVAVSLFEKEAKSKNITSEVLIAQEITAKVPEPSDADIQKVYEENKQQLGGAALEQVKPRIVEFLKQQKAEERHEAYVTELKKKYPTTIALKPPVIEVGTAGRPEKGGAKAPVTIIMFSDYECPYCKRAEVVVAEVTKTYGDKVKLVFRDYPLPFHATARPAAEAAACANAQGKFWEYHDKLFAASDLSNDKLKAMAGELKLDQKKFDDCLAKQEFKAVIDKDMEEGAAVGVNGTPAFFINGRMLSGAQPFEKFKEIIDEELARSPAPAA
ncbi:MAG TPA: thioredoxin domain-containing protein [Candidatus Binatia bacterium]|jgi:protein-disulfide isomerase|nr:thioredoxin domain-containing protein [Candidatus Binatia bacterium]